MRKPRINTILKKQLENLDKFTGQSMETINLELRKVLKAVIGKESIIDMEDLKNDRDLLEVNMESYAFLYCLANNISYTKGEHRKPLTLTPPKIYEYMLDYKMDNYGEAIMNELGFTIAGRMENGDFKIRELTPEEKEIQSKLN